jgi:hypothetical protein
VLGDAILHAVRRAVSRTAESVERKAAWTAAAAIFLACGLIAALIAVYGFLEPRVGSLIAALSISAACLLVGFICLSLPALIERAERRRAEAERTTPSVHATATTKDEEPKEAVDYFGAIRVVGSAFLFGLGAARKLKGRRHASQLQLN